MARKLSISFTLDPEQYEKLTALSNRTKVAKSVYVRQAVERILEEEIEKLQLPLFGDATKAKRASNA